MWGGKFLVKVTRCPHEAPVQLDVHLAFTKIHDIVAVPDPAIGLDFLIVDRCSISISVLFDLEKMPVIPVPDIHLPVPRQAWNNVLFVLAFLIPLDHQPNKFFLGQ